MNEIDYEQARAIEECSEQVKPYLFNLAHYPTNNPAIAKFAKIFHKRPVTLTFAYPGENFSRSPNLFHMPEFIHHCTVQKPR